MHGRRQAKHVDMRHLGHNHAKHHRVAMHHLVAIGTETLAAKLDGKIHIAGLVEFLELLVTEFAPQQVSEKVVCGHEVQRNDLARFPHMDRPVRMHVKV